jgi:hypothetical protein|tara:strand:+ start:312 stop:644 length:333 start_codon:yes stop_codon:yes gene_type:complete
MESILNINLSNARGTDEDFTTYKNRLRSNKKVLKLYRTYGREAFQTMFPNGVSEALENSTEQIYNENNPDWTSDDDASNTKQTNYQSKVNKSQNVNSKSTSQTQKSGRGK